MKCNILIPCYNGGKFLVNNLPILFNYIKNLNYDFEITIVNDGSSDNTLELLEQFKDKITILTYEKNKGKGGAINYGISHCNKCDLIIFMDCDFSTDLKAIEDSIKSFEQGYDVIIGSRNLKESVLPVKRTLKRRITSKCCNIFVNSLFHFKLKDTQCGFKCFEYNFSQHIAKVQIINDWSFDVEYLYISKLNNKKMKEIPVVWTENNDSRVHIFKASTKFIKSLFKIKRNKKNYIDENKH